jgi:CRP-like cAMP-binding protein
MKTLEEITSMREITKSDPIYFAQEPSTSIFFLKTGRVKLTRTSPDGKEMIIALVNPISERIEELIFKDAPQRVVSFLLNYANDQGKKIGEEIFVKPFFTHQDIAEFTACSRQTVNSILTDLREKKIINFDRKKLVIQKEDELRKFLK